MGEVIRKKELKEPFKRMQSQKLMSPLLDTRKKKKYIQL